MSGVSIKDLVHATQRVEALSEVIRRHGATIVTLTAAINRELALVPPEVHERLEDAIKDAQAQVAATEDALDRAQADLPEGGGSE